MTLQETSLVTYHSSFCKAQAELACGFPVLPLKGSSSGPAARSDDPIDVVDEAITLFRSTIMFKNFKPEGPADKVIVYLTVFIQKCLLDIQRKSIACSRQDAQSIVDLLVKEAVPATTDAKFFMRQLGLLTQPKGNAEEDKFRKYVTQLKSECARRLLDTIYDNDAMDLKFWLQFGKKPFLGQKFNDKL